MNSNARAQPKMAPQPTATAHAAGATARAAPTGSGSSSGSGIGGLDASQLASIMWTVKSSMIEEIGQLLDRKLAPVLARLDGIDRKLDSLEREVIFLRDPDQDT